MGLDFIAIEMGMVQGGEWMGLKPIEIETE